MDYLLPFKHIRLVVPRGKPTVDPTKSSRQNGGDNTQRQGSPPQLPDADTTKDWRKANKRSSDKTTSADQLKYGVRGVEPWRKPAQTPRAYNDCRRLHGTDGLRVFSTK